MNTIQRKYFFIIFSLLLLFSSGTVHGKELTSSFHNFPIYNFSLNENQHNASSTVFDVNTFRVDQNFEINNPLVRGHILVDSVTTAGIEYYNNGKWVLINDGTFGPEEGFNLSNNTFRFRTFFCLDASINAQLSFNDSITGVRIFNKNFTIHSSNIGNSGHCNGNDTTTDPGNGGGNNGTSTATTTDQGSGGNNGGNNSTSTATSTVPTDTVNNDNRNAISSSSLENSRSGSRSGSRSNNNNSSNQGEVLGVSTTTSCQPLLTTYLHREATNSVVEVIKLQTFFNQSENTGLIINGNFDNATYEAVRAYQLKYAEEIIHPWVTKGLLMSNNDTTGYVYLTTRKHINEKYCLGYTEAIPTLSPDINILNGMVN